MPAHKTLTEPPRVYIPGEISLHVLEFRRTVNVYVSNFNAGAEKVMSEFEKRYRRKWLEITHETPPQLLPQLLGVKKRSLSGKYSGRGSSVPSQRGSLLILKQGANILQDTLARATNGLGNGNGLRSSIRRLSFADSKLVTHMLLYLNSETFADIHRESLIFELKRARVRGIEIILVHECDSARGGCAFSHFFETTPDMLIEHGLYKRIAVALYPGQHRTVSMALMAKELGAVKKRSKVKGALVASARSSSQRVSDRLRRGSSARSITSKTPVSNMNLTRIISHTAISAPRGNSMSSRESATLGT
eukprot:6993480-Prymnesium_polylepis.1